MKRVRLGQIATISRDGVDPSNVDPETHYLGLEHIERGGRILGYETVASAGIKSTKFRFTPQHVLFGKLRPNLGKIARPRRAGVCSTDILPVLPGPELDRDFLFHYLSQPQIVAFAASQATGANLPRLSPKSLEEFAIPLPSLDEQRRIAAIFDRTDELRALRLMGMAALDELVRSLFNEASQAGPSTVMPLSDAYWFQEGPGIRKWQFTDTGVKLLNVGNITSDGRLDLSKTDRHVSVEEANGRYKHFLVDPGDLVIASSGISFDADGLLRTRGAFVNEMDLPLCMNTSTIRFKAQTGLSGLTYLRSWLNSAEFRSQISRLVTGSAQQNFGPSHLRQLQITLPPVSIQERFAAQVKAVELQRSKWLEGLVQSDQLTAAIQFDTFSGRV